MDIFQKFYPQNKEMWYNINMSQVLKDDACKRLMAFYPSIIQKQDDIVSQYKEFYQNIINKQDSIVSEYKKEFIEGALEISSKIVEKREEIKAEYGLTETENIFTSILKNYWHEKFHSQVLCEILKPKKSLIGSEENLKEFLRLIGLNPDDWNIKNTFVETEVSEPRFEEIWLESFPHHETKEKKKKTYGDIDILICDGNNCVIIENKMNNADDQPNQLPRYVRVAENQGLKIQKVVYLPLTDEKQPPKIDSYDAEYCDKYDKEILSKTQMILPAIKKIDEKQPALVQDFLEKIIPEQVTESNKTKLVFLEQYKNLIANLGEKEIMGEMQKQLVEFLYSEGREKYTEELHNLFKKKCEEVNKLKLEIIAEKLNFTKQENGYYGEKFTYDEDKEFFLYIATWQYGISIKTKKLCDELYKNLNGLLPETSNAEGCYWIFKCLGDDFVDESIEESVKIFKEGFAEIKKRLKN